MEASALPERKRVYVMTHTKQTELGKIKVKTIGKMLDEKITIEGLFSIVLRTVIQNGNHLFSTRNNGQDTVKTPMGLFSEEFIDNDLVAIDAAIQAYYGIPGEKSPEGANADTVKPSAPSDKPECQDENIEKKLPSWIGQDPEKIIAMIGSKYTLSEAQKTRIRVGVLPERKAA